MQRTSSGTTVREPVALALVAGLSIAVAALLAVSLWHDGGAVVYTLDDAYIHLRLAANIARGHYGIAPGEASSPSSSILWPLLLAPFAALAWFEWVPFAICLLAAAGIAVVFARVLREAVGPAHTRAQVVAQVACGLLALLVCNTVGLVFLGLEHELQVLLSLLLVLELFRVARGAAPGRATWLLVVLGPLVRYENLALSAAALVFLAARGHRRHALVSAGVLLALLGGFSLFLLAQGLPAVPSSVLAKLGDPDLQGRTRTPLEHLMWNLTRTWSGGWVVLSIAGLMAAAVRPATSAERGLALALAAVLAAHLVLGSFGGFHRYEAYLLAVGLAGTALLHRERLARARARAPRLTLAAATALLLAASVRSATVALASPLAIHELHRQQFQMASFASDYWRRPVAVNDLGLVSFHARERVLDLWGLGSPGVLARRRGATSMAWADSVCRTHGVQLVMIYDAWFPPPPAGWQPVAELRVAPGPQLPISHGILKGFARLWYGRRPTVVVASRHVRFYVTDPAFEPAARVALERWSATLVAGSEFRLE